MATCATSVSAATLGHGLRSDPADLQEIRIAFSYCSSLGTTVIPCWLEILLNRLIFLCRLLHEHVNIFSMIRQLHNPFAYFLEHFRFLALVKFSKHLCHVIAQVRSCERPVPLQRADFRSSHLLFTLKHSFFSYWGQYFSWTKTVRFDSSTPMWISELLQVRIEDPQYKFELLLGFLSNLYVLF